MSTSHQHYLEAERLLAEAQNELLTIEGPTPMQSGGGPGAKIAAAHVHAILATIPICGHRRDPLR